MSISIAGVGVVLSITTAACVGWFVVARLIFVTRAEIYFELTRIREHLARIDENLNGKKN